MRPDLVTTSCAAHLLGHPQHPGGAQEVGAPAGDRVEARDRLDVVVEDVGALGDHLCQRHLLAAEVGGQHLDLAARRQLADRADHADEGAGAVVGEVVAVDRGDHRVPEAHPLHLVGDPQRLQRVVPGRLARLHVAEAAAPRADVAEDHEGGRAALPALADIGAVGLLADRVKVVVLDRLLQPAVVRAARRGDLQPGRLALAEADLAIAVRRPTAGLRPRAGDMKALVEGL